jgi:AcrR family transcriptional regulator
MPRADREATRLQLLEAGQKLVQSRPLGQLRIDDVVEAAGVAKGTFYLHFSDRADYLVTLHRRFHDELMSEVQRATKGQPPGLPRLLAGSLAYLDGCRREHPVKALLIEARAEPAIQAEIAAQNVRFAQRAARDFEAAGWPAPAEAARLWIGMVAEGALLEAEAGTTLSSLGQALARFLQVG